MNKNTSNDENKQGTQQQGGSSTGSQNKSWEGFERHATGEGKGARKRGQAQMMGSEEEGGLQITRIKEIGRNLGDQLETQMQERPYVVLGAVAGVGFVAGSLLGSRLGQIAIALAGGYLVRNLLTQAAGPGGMQRVVKEGIEKITGQERQQG